MTPSFGLFLPGSCLPSQFMCDDYRCLDEAAVCDGVKDCRMGEDELHCCK